MSASSTGVIQRPSTSLRWEGRSARWYDPKKNSAENAVRSTQARGTGPRETPSAAEVRKLNIE